MLVEEGLQMVERSLIPACQKTGKMVYLLLTNDTVSFVQDEKDTGGMIVTATVKTVRAGLACIQREGGTVQEKNGCGLLSYW